MSLGGIAAAVIVAPNYIDWNQYRNDLAKQATSIIGRKVEIRGDVKISLLPRPALEINDISLANLDETTNAKMVSLKAIELQVALLPLLKRNIQIPRIIIIDPIVNVELLPDGRNNLSFQPASSAELDETRQKQKSLNQTDAGSPPTDKGGPSVPKFTIQIDNFVVKNGTVNYQNATNNHLEKISKINGIFRIGSLQGPIDAKGKALVRGIPVDFSASVGKTIKGRTLPFNMASTIPSGRVKASFNGFISNIRDNPLIKGEVSLDIGNSKKALSTLVGLGGLPETLERPSSGTARVVFDQKKLLLQDLTLELLGAKGLGSAELTLGNNIDTNLTLSVDSFDLDAILSSTNANIPKIQLSPNNVIPEKRVGIHSSRSGISPPPVTPKFSSLGLASLSDKLNASLDLSVKTLKFKNDIIKNTKISASLTNNEIIKIFIEKLHLVTVLKLDLVYDIV